MKRWTVSFADSLKPVKHPERTAKRDSGFDVTFREWPTRDAMLRVIEEQGERAPRRDDWKPLVK